MCSAFIMLNVLIFALPMSSTQIVISGLTGISLIYFTSSETETSWFFEEILMWVSMPVLAMALSYGVYKAIKKHIYACQDAQQRIVRCMPFQITFTFTTMFYVALTKNFLKSKTYRKNHSNNFGLIFFCLMFSFPVIVLPLSRYYLLRRARNLDWISHGRMQKQKQIRLENKLRLKQDPNASPQDGQQMSSQLFKMESNYSADILAALKFWDSTPLINAYFH